MDTPSRSTGRVFDKVIAVVLAIAGVWFGWLDVMYLAGSSSGSLDWWLLSGVCMAIVIAFCFTFAARVFVGRRINALALTTATLIAMFALIAGLYVVLNLNAAAGGFFMAILFFVLFLPFVSGIAAVLAILGFMALFWPVKKPTN